MHLTGNIPACYTQVLLVAQFWWSKLFSSDPTAVQMLKSFCFVLSPCLLASIFDNVELSAGVCCAALNTLHDGCLGTAGHLQSQNSSTVNSRTFYLYLSLTMQAYYDSNTYVLKDASVWLAASDEAP